VETVRGWKRERGFSYSASGARQNISVYLFVESSVNLTSLNSLICAYFVNSLFVIVKQGIFYDKNRVLKI
jgi:hypothetical protein